MGILIKKLIDEKQMIQSQNSNDSQKNARDWLVELSKGVKISPGEQDLFLKEFFHIIQRLAILFLSFDVPENREGEPKEEINQINHKVKDAFCRKYKITMKDRKIISEILAGANYEEIGNLFEFTGSNVNKRLTLLRKRMGIKNVEQIIFAFGWMRLIKPNSPFVKDSDE